MPFVRCPAKPFNIKPMREAFWEPARLVIAFRGVFMQVSQICHYFVCTLVLLSTFLKCHFAILRVIIYIPVSSDLL